ncbi:hypothetical protein [Bacillus sp. FSL H8-0545]
MLSSRSVVDDQMSIAESEGLLQQIEHTLNTTIFNI